MQIHSLKRLHRGMGIYPTLGLVLNLWRGSLLPMAASGPTRRLGFLTEYISVL